MAATEHGLDTQARTLRLCVRLRKRLGLLALVGLRRALQLLASTACGLIIDRVVCA